MSGATEEIHRQPRPSQYDMVVGGGLHRLRAFGLTVRVFEAGSGVGGTG